MSDMFKKGILLKLLWYLLKPCLQLHQILQLRQQQNTQIRTLITLN